jgi:tetratricopeptide (TPR) repeat protein
MKESVQVWVEDVIIPTYAIGKPEKNPMFLEKRIYQGSSGVVYPHAVIEKIYDEKADRSYRAVHLENEYLKIMVLPELGGRIQMAYDKVKQRHFIYYNQVIKPALVGLTGPWISGGIEFNWPQHHRPSTFEPVDFTITEQEDGSKTIWVNEVERMFRTKGMAGFTLYPGKAYLEVTGKLYNRTPFPQTFLWWANPAVKVNEHYQTVFPPDVHAVFDHGRRDVSDFPIATGTYYKVDYAPGTDISRYSNIPVPTSYMAVSSRYNFVGGYEHDTKGGLLHIADYHIAPGKKQWTWGHGAFGQAWDRNLTDEDGPYIELMTGIFTDNQPDFSWIQPGETKTFTQYFMPYREVGVVKNATREAVVNVEYNGQEADVKLYVTAVYEQLELSFTAGDKVLWRQVISSSPAAPYLDKVVLEGNTAEMIFTVTDLLSGQQLVSCKQEVPSTVAVPPPAAAALRPAAVENNEQLFLTGLHLEQYRHATYRATDYYEEALRRDEGDARCNNALGCWWLRHGQFAIAEKYLQKAIDTLTQRNPNPYDGEPYYNLGWTLKFLGRIPEAYDAFYKAVWNDAWQHTGYLNLARIAVMRQDYRQALEFAGNSLVRNYHSHTVRHLKVVILRKLNRVPAALLLVEESLALDPFNYGCLYEKYLLTGSEVVLTDLQVISRLWDHNFIEYALDYAHAGLYDEAATFLQRCPANTMVTYYLGWLAYQAGDKLLAEQHFREAAVLSPDYVFPNRLEDLLVLQTAVAVNPADSQAYYYLGNFWYEKRQYTDAIACWERSVQVKDTFPTVYRNLSLAYYNKQQDAEKALLAMERAFGLDNTDARVLMELDQLYKKLNKDHLQRLQLLEAHLPLVMQREDLYLERIVLYNQLGQYEQAVALLADFSFHPWEGGEGKVITQHLIAHIELAKKAIRAQQPSEALRLLVAAENYPEHLGEGKLYGTPEHDIHYWKGVAYEMSGQDEEARHYFTLATRGNPKPVQAIFYNDPQPDKIFYQGLAWLKLGEERTIFHDLVDFGQLHLHDQISIDYFAVSLPDLLVFDADLDLRNHIHCLYIMGLGKLGLGEVAAANTLFDQVLQLDINHQGALIHKTF